MDNPPSSAINGMELAVCAVVRLPGPRRPRPAECLDDRVDFHFFLIGRDGNDRIVLSRFHQSCLQQRPERFLSSSAPTESHEPWIDEFLTKLSPDRTTRGELRENRPAFIKLHDGIAVGSKRSC